MGCQTKRFRAFSFVWLLLCLPATHIYAESANIEGLLMRVFMYGVFASPVWLTYGWGYLYEEKAIKSWFYIPVIIASILWGLAESIEGGYNSEQRTTLALVSGIAFLVLAHPFFHYPSWLRVLGVALNPFHDTKSASLLAPPTNRLIHIVARLLLCLFLWLVVMVIIHGYAAQNEMVRHKANGWSVDILPFIAIAVFSKRIGFVRKMTCFFGTLLTYGGAVLLLDELVSIVATHVLDVNNVTQFVRIAQVQMMLNTGLMLMSYSLLYAWIRKKRRALELSAISQ